MQRCKEEDNFTNRRQAMLEGKRQSQQPPFYSNPKYLQIIENNYFFFSSNVILFCVRNGNSCYDSAIAYLK